MFYELFKSCEISRVASDDRVCKYPALFSPSSSSAGGDACSGEANLSQSSLFGSWLAIPRICKAVSFYAQPTPMALKERSVVATSLYESFAV
jgi:hypothetical protein